LPNGPDTTARLVLRDEMTELLGRLSRVTAILIDRSPLRDRWRAALDAGLLQLVVEIDDRHGLLVLSCVPTGSTEAPRAFACAYACPSDPRFGRTPDDVTLDGPVQ